MSVLKNQRSIAENEYKRTFKELYRTIRMGIFKVAKRKQKWLCKDISKYLNGAFNDVLATTEGYFKNGIQQKNDLVKHAIMCLNELEKPLLVLWNIEKYPQSKMINWSDLVYKEVCLLNELLKGENVVEHMNKIMTINWKRIKSASFLSNMSQLHRVVHSKAIHIPNCYDDFDTSILIKQVDDAWYCLLKANEKYPKTKEDYEKRRKNISNAISALYKMQRPITSFFNIMQYSENTMKSISTMINEEIKMLLSLQKSDKARFSDLI
jgi:hypothetical protein